MLYIKSYFKKELQQTYVRNYMGNLKKIAYAAFLGLFSVAIYFFLQTLSKTVIADTFPYIMQASYFSTLYIYNVVAFIGYLLYFIMNYEVMSFAEIRKNRWYMMIKMGYKPIPMIFSKIVALILSLIFVYSAGFLFTAVLSVFLKFNFIFGYLPSLYIVGLLDLLVISMAFMAISLFAQSATAARYSVVIFAVGEMALRVLLGYRSIVINRVAMQSAFVLFDFGKSIYLPIALVFIVLCFIVCLIRAKQLSQYYSLPYDTYGYKMPADADVVRLKGKKNKPVSLNIRDKAIVRSKVLNAITITVLVLLILVSLGFNVFIILMSTSQPGTEAVIGGKIPYIFVSNTMEPAIMENDLAFFTKIDVQKPVNVGDIVLFMDRNAVFVERVIDVSGSSYKVDIDHYPPMAQKGVMEKTIDRSAIHGVFAFANRWLGAMILFANTILGRLILLVVPAFLLFFNKPIKGFFDKRRRSFEEDLL